MFIYITRYGYNSNTLRIYVGMTDQLIRSFVEQPPALSADKRFNLITTLRGWGLCLVTGFVIANRDGIISRQPVGGCEQNDWKIAPYAVYPITMYSIHGRMLPEKEIDSLCISWCPFEHKHPGSASFVHVHVERIGNIVYSGF